MTRTGRTIDTCPESPGTELGRTNTDLTFPEMVLARQAFANSPLADPAGYLEEKLAALDLSADREGYLVLPWPA